MAASEATGLNTVGRKPWASAGASMQFGGSAGVKCCVVVKPHPLSVKPPLKPSRSEFVPIRTLSYHVRLWGKPEYPKLFMLHGWMDVGASFQFLVDALARDWCVIAPDWRGYGLTACPKTDAYWFPDYMADLDLLLKHYSPNAPVKLIGHSLGGNVACLYAGARPQRIEKLVNLEGFGMRRTDPRDAPKRYAKFFDEIATPPSLKPYADFDALASRLMQGNPRLSESKAKFLAHHWGVAEQGVVRLRADPAHKVVNATLYRIEEAFACWEAITAPVLCVAAAQSEMLSKWITPEDYRERLTHFKHLSEATINEAGHMLHHDQPEALARLIEDFL
jgi:pimeloyl-ACP methyl ester carboxylesterase